MHLAGRLRNNRFINYTGVYWKWKDEIHEGMVSLVDFVLNRYASRFGVVEPDKAKVLQARLLNKYFGYTAARFTAIRQMEYRDFNYYPLSKREELLAEWLCIERIRNAVSYATNNPCGPYGRTSESAGCLICGAPTFYYVYENGVEKEVMCGWNRFHVCKDKRCRALAAYFPRANFFNIEKFLIRVLLEVTKNGGKNNAYKRGLEKHFVRHTGQIHEQRDRCCTS